MTLCLTALSASSASVARVALDLRRDGVPVLLSPPGALEAEFAAQLGGDSKYPFKNFSASYVATALNTGIDWRVRGLVTPAKDQGAHGYCGTFGRVASAEGQYARLGTHGLRNFSEEELVDCIGWDRDQFSYFKTAGFIDSVLYPYNTTGPDMDPPIPGNPCRYSKANVIENTDKNAFTNMTGGAKSEEQLAAFIFHNGPVSTGINANVLGMRAKGCEVSGVLTHSRNRTLSLSIISLSLPCSSLSLSPLGIGRLLDY